MSPGERSRLYRAIRGRLEVGDSIAQFADRAELSRSTLYSWTGGQIDPEWESLRRVAATLDLPLWVLVREIEITPMGSHEGEGTHRQGQGPSVSAVRIEGRKASAVVLAGATRTAGSARTATGHVGRRTQAP